LTEQQCDGIFLSHASEDKENVVEPFIDCLEKAGIHNIWYDKNEIEEGHSIIRKINKGLENSKIGIVIITPHFIRKDFTNWELETLLELTIINEIRLIPLIKNITREEIVKKYRLLAPLRFKEISNECDPDLIEHIRNYLKIGDTLIDHPNNYEIVLNQESKKKISVIKEVKIRFDISDIDDIDKETIALIYNKIQTGTQGIKNLNITKIREFATKRRIWVHKEAWDLIKHLVFSDNIFDIKDGIYVLGEMVKLAKSENITYVSKNVEELFFFKLLEFSNPLNDKNISHDVLNVLEIIVKPDVFFNICISVLLKSMEDITDNSHYSAYIQFFFNKIAIHKNSNNISLLITRLEYLIETSSKETTKKRAEHFADLIIRDYQRFIK
jgi:hypothetical protein